MRELKEVEISHVSGGIVPLLILGAAVLTLGGCAGCATRGKTKPDQEQDQE